MRNPMLLIAAALLPLTVPVPVSAQDVGGALDMGQLTGSLSQDHITQSERARARRRGGSSARNARYCANMSQFRARYGSGDARVRRLGTLCRRGGYRTR